MHPSARSRRAAVAALVLLACCLGPPAAAPAPPGGKPAPPAKPAATEQPKTPAETPRDERPGKDRHPPKSPTDLVVTAATDSSLTLTWTPSKDNRGTTGYVISLNGVAAATSEVASVTLQGLHCGATYTVGVSATDAAGNHSDETTVAATTAACASSLFVAPDGADYKWSHLALTYDGTTLSLYVDGALASSRAVSGALATGNGALALGGNSIWGEWFHGRLDDVRVYSRALSASEIRLDEAAAVTAASPAPNAAGLVAAYSFDAGSGSTVADLSGSANDGTIAGAAWTAAGRDGGALDFDGTDDSVTIPPSPSLAPSRALTVEGWVAPAELGDLWRTVLVKEDGGHLDYALYANTDSDQPSAHVYVGSDTWTRGAGPLETNTCASAVAPCRSFDRAYHAAQPGQLVQVAPGTYGDQDVRYDATKTSTADVVFAPPSGKTATIGSLVLGPDAATRGASHATFRDLTLTGDISIYGCGAPSGSQCQPDATSGGADLTFQNLSVHGSTGFFCASCSDVRILGGTIGPLTYGSPCNGSNHPEVQNAYDAQLSGARKLKRSHDLLVDGVVFQNFSSCVAYEDHTECLQVEPADNVVIRNSIFRRCDTITVNFANDLAGDSRSPAGYAAPDNVLIENNFFDEAKSLPGAPTYYALNVRECTNCVVRYNSWLQAPRLPDGEIAKNVRFVGNLGPFVQRACATAGVTFSHDVWVGASCNSTDRDVVDPGFVSPATADLHLLATSPAVDAGDPGDTPATDIDGRHRPAGAAPDAGAHELR